MVKKTIYRSPEGRNEVMAIYDRTLAKTGIDYETKTIKTRFGETHVIISGPKEAEPLICLHGGNSNSAHLLGNIKPLVEEYRVHAVDIIGHPGKSAEVRLSGKDYSYGEWLLDVIDSLGFVKVKIYCGSYSAGIVLRLAALKPDRINRVFMVVPSGIANGSSINYLTKLVIPWLRFRIKPNRKNVIRTIKALMTEYDDDLLDFIEANLKHVKIASGMPRISTKEELKDFIAPVMIIAAKDDIMFPARRVIPRAKEILPNLVHAETIEGLHASTKELQLYINEKSLKFLREEY